MSSVLRGLIRDYVNDMLYRERNNISCESGWSKWDDNGRGMCLCVKEDGSWKIRFDEKRGGWSLLKEVVEVVRCVSEDSLWEIDFVKEGYRYKGYRVWWGFSWFEVENDMLWLMIDDIGWEVKGWNGEWRIGEDKWMK